MATGAPDHHSTLEVKIDDLSTLMTAVILAVNNLKTTLTDLNVSPPTAEAPWAVKNVGSAGYVMSPGGGVPAETTITMLELAGSGQLLSLIVNIAADDVESRDAATLKITIDGSVKYNDLIGRMFPGTLVATTGLFHNSGIVISEAAKLTFFYCVPTYYATSLKLEYTNNHNVNAATVSFFTSYTNLP